MLELLNAYIGYQKGHQRKVIGENLNFRANRGELIALLGRNGIGKSTLLKSLSGFIPFLDGQITFENNKLFGLVETSKLVSIIQSSFSQVPYLIVVDYILMGRAPHTNFFGTLKDEDMTKLNWAIDLLKITHLKNRPLDQLSDGEKQKVQIARCLCQDTPIILMDEPTNFLDVPSKIEIFKLLKQLTEKEQKIIIMSTHELDLSLKHTHTIWALGNGLSKQGDANSEEIKSFLGQIFNMNF